MPRFVILEHDHPFRHWDFLLEAGDTLKAWRLLREPQGGAPIEAELLPNHRPLYLDYEGPVSGGRGRVSRWDSGTFEWQDDLPDAVVVALTGSRIRACVELRKGEKAWTWSTR
jgi:hypothetical protein